MHSISSSLSPQIYGWTSFKLIRGEPERAPNSVEPHGKFAVPMYVRVCMYVAICRPHDHHAACAMHKAALCHSK